MNCAARSPPTWPALSALPPLECFTQLLDSDDQLRIVTSLILAVEVDGQEIITVEGISKDGLSKVQESMIDNNSFQCGFCAPGVIISATELLNNNPHPTREDIKEALSGNLCRCTGYLPILEAVENATKE